MANKDVRRQHAGQKVSGYPVERYEMGFEETGNVVSWTGRWEILIPTHR